jgi:integrase
MADLNRARIVRRLRYGQAVELDWGVVLAPPSQPGARGANGSYRWSFYDPPVREDGSRGKRVQHTARQLDDKAWLRIEADLHDLEAAMTAQSTGTPTDVTFAQLAEHWLDPGRHPDWSRDYVKKVTSVTANWLLADSIVVVRRAPAERSERVPLAELPLSELTAANAIEALHHVLQQRAYGTYRTTHECLTAILTWGLAIKWIPPGQVHLADIKRAPDPRSRARRMGARGNIAPVPKDDIPDLEQVLLPFHRWVEDQHGRDDRILLDLLAFSGPRIGELLAAHVDRFHRDDEGNGWLSVEERAERNSKKQAPPKHRKHRDVWVPSWLADDLETIQPNRDGYFFGAPQGSTWPAVRWSKRRFERWAIAYGWERLPDYCPHEDHEAPTCSGQNRRRWRFTPHDWRHAAAVWQLFELRLDPEDVAQHLGHGDGYTLYQLYVGARPGRSHRAAKAVADLGDPRR